MNGWFLILLAVVVVPATFYGFRKINLKLPDPKVYENLSTILILVGLAIFFCITFFTSVDLSPSHIYEEAMSKVVAVIAIFILCGAAWFGFPKNNKVRFLGMFVGGTLLAAIVIGGLSNHAKNTLPQNTLRVNGHSDSARVPVKVGHGLAWSGNSFSVHCVYRDGRPEVVINDLSRACDTGPLLEEYVHNNSSVEQIYTYEDVR